MNENIILSDCNEEHIQLFKENPNVELYLMAEHICKIYNINVDELISKRRYDPLPFARHTFIKLSFSTHRFSKSALGRYLSNRNHATIISSLKAHDDLIKYNKPYQKKFDEILQSIRTTQTQSQCN